MFASFVFRNAIGMHLAYLYIASFTPEPVITGNISC